MEYIDLGLPSGTLWATRSIGSSKNTEIGNYYKWGATKPYKSLTSYGSVSTSSTDILGTLYDTALVVLGSPWKLPTKEQADELLSSDNTTSELTTINGVEGRLFTSKVNGGSIFMPESGYRRKDYGDIYNKSTNNGYFWTSTPVNSSESYNIYFYSNYLYLDSKDKGNGLLIYAVINKSDLL